jgi:hypothetical protein
MKRPVGVTALAALAILGGIYQFAALLLSMRDYPSTQHFVLSQPKTWVALAQAIPFVLSLSWTAAGIGLWRLRKWGRRLVIFLCLLAIIVLAVLLWKQFGADVFSVDVWLRLRWPALLPVVVYGLFLGYMFTDEVKRAFSA